MFGQVGNGVGASSYGKVVMRGRKGLPNSRQAGLLNCIRGWQQTRRGQYCKVLERPRGLHYALLTRKFEHALAGSVRLQL